MPDLINLSHKTEEGAVKYSVNANAVCLVTTMEYTDKNRKPQTQVWLHGHNNSLVVDQKHDEVVKLVEDAK